MVNILDYSYDEIENLMLSMGEQKFRAKQLYSGLYEGKSFDEISNISKLLKEKFKLDITGGTGAGSYESFDCAK